MQRSHPTTTITHRLAYRLSNAAGVATVAVSGLCAALWITACSDDDSWDKRADVYELVRYNGDQLPFPATATAIVSETLVLNSSPDRAMQHLVYQYPSGPETVTRRLIFSRHEQAYFIDFYCDINAGCPAITSPEYGTTHGDTLTFANRGYPSRIYVRRR